MEADVPAALVALASGSIVGRVLPVGNVALAGRAPYQG